MESKVKVAAEEEKKASEIKIDDVKIIEKSAEENKENGDSEKEDYEAPTDDKIVTVKDLCKIGRSDIPSKSKKDLLYNTVVTCASSVLNTSKNRNILLNTDTK